MNNNLIELKKKGKILLREGCALIDTSNRTKDLDRRSVLALSSNKINFTASMTSSEKRNIFGKLRQKYSEDRTYAIMHSVKLYYALHNKIILLPCIYICGEGLDIGLVKQHLQTLLNIEYNENKIKFLPSLKPMFGKKNIAHELARKVRRKKQKPTIEIEEKDFKKLKLV